MIAKTGLTLVRVKTMADNGKRIEIDCGEMVTLGQLDDLLGTTITAVLLPDNDRYTEALQRFINDLNQLNDRT